MSHFDALSLSLADSAFLQSLASASCDSIEAEPLQDVEFLAAVPIVLDPVAPLSLNDKPAPFVDSNLAKPTKVRVHQL